MDITGFIYDGISSEDFNLFVCGDSSGGIETSSDGTQINWNTVPVNNGRKYEVTQITYDAVLETDFRVVKLNCETHDFEELSFEERRKIARWLQRRDDHVLQLIGKDEAYDYIQFEGHFTITDLYVNGKHCGYDLHFTNNRPFATGKLVHYDIHANTANYVSKKIYDISDEEGYIYPKKLQITCKASGNLEIHNAIEDRTLVIKNCSAGEVITFDSSLNFTTSLPSHEIQNDFNYSFFRISNSYTDKQNTLTISIPCDITIEYLPIIKGVAL